MPRRSGPSDLPVLGSYPAQRCARRVHNEFAPGPRVALPISPEVQARIDAGRLFESAIFDEIRDSATASGGAVADLTIAATGEDWDRGTQRTLEAIGDGADVIIGGRLPEINSRSGAPDVLVRHGEGYLPVDVKNHRTLRASAKPAKPANPRPSAHVLVSALTAPDVTVPQSGYSNRATSWQKDVMQLAHYTRMLQELGFHAGPLLGGIIGTSDMTALLGCTHAITWYDLDIADVATYSRSSPTHVTKRSALQRYDHEFGFRVAVAAAARSGEEIVRPYHVTECATCEWFDHCTEVAGPADASFATETGLLTVRQWRYLYTQCGDGTALSIDELAAADPATHSAGFCEHSPTGLAPAQRLENVIRRARMTVAGVDLELDGAQTPEVPQADIEIDFDIEWDLDQRIYQWGLRIRDCHDDGTARYEPIVSFYPLDDDAEAALAEQFAARINALCETADRLGRSLRIFHWNHPEISLTKRFPAVQRVLDGVTVDLMKWFASVFFCRTSLSIKDVAAIFGFFWDVENAGGEASQYMIDVARGDGPEAAEARRWCLRYNECDVAAQAAIRDGVRQMLAGSARPQR